MDLVVILFTLAAIKISLLIDGCRLDIQFNVLRISGNNKREGTDKEAHIFKH